MTAKAIEIAGAVAVFDPHIAADDPAQFPEALQKRRVASLVFRIVRRPGHEHADATHPAALLRARCERPRCRAAEKGDELASSHGCPLIRSPRRRARAATAAPLGRAPWRS